MKDNMDNNNNTNSSGFLPEEYEVPSSGGNYLKLREGPNKIRALSSPLLVWVYWEDTPEGRRPVRSSFENKPNVADVKHCWILEVWDYHSGSIAVAEFTQASIQEGLRDLARNPAWGDPRQYDITITRKGTGLETKYTLMPSPKSELPADIQAAVDTSNIDLEVMLEGGNPFGSTNKDAA